MKQHGTGGPPRDEDDEAVDKPERAPSFLTARELQALASAKREPAGSGESKGGRLDDSQDDAIGSKKPRNAKPR